MMLREIDYCISLLRMYDQHFLSGLIFQIIVVDMDIFETSHLALSSELKGQYLIPEKANCK